MIIWINGAYAAGKSTIAAELANQLPEAIVYDPEPLGYYLRDLVKPVVRSQDYQDLAIFAPVVVETARQLCLYGHTVIMPLGVWQRARFAQIRTGLQTFSQVNHYCLIASRTTINRHLLYRGDSQQAQRWIHERLDDALEAVADLAFDDHIAVDDASAAAVARQILTREEGRR